MARRGTAYRYIVHPWFEEGPPRSVVTTFPFPCHRTVAEADAEEAEKRNRQEILRELGR